MTWRWLPASEEELQIAAANGSLKEGHYLDLKRAFSTKSTANRDLAIDMASFAVDGGLILIGVDERSEPPTLEALPILGQKERIDQIALTRIDPPLRVRVAEIPTRSQTLGYIGVLIPPSPTAPHMVDHIYRGRSDTTNTQLSDAEVRRIRDERARSEQRIEPLMEEWAGRAPMQVKGAPPRAELFVVAEPEYPRSGMLHAALPNGLQDFVGTLDGRVRPLTDNWDPDLRHARTMPRATGWALTNLDEGRQARFADSRVLDVEIHEDGGVRLYALVSEHVGSPDQHTISDVRLHGLVLRVVQIAAAISDAASYLGGWKFAVLVRGTAGVISGYALWGLLPPLVALDAESYFEATTGSVAEIEEEPLAIVERLTGRLNRALTQGAYPLPRPRELR